MATSKARADSMGDWLVRTLCAAVAAWLAINIYSLLFADYAMARFWETWFMPGTPVAEWAPIVAISLITGIVIGVVIGFVFPNHALKVAIIAAAMQFVAAVVSGTVASSVFLAAGLTLGALPTRRGR